jgi:di/tricarboxylate transporter
MLNLLHGFITFRDEDLASDACKRMMEISFVDWMMFNIPPMIVNTLLCWIYLQVHFLGLPNFLKFWKKKSEKDNQSKAMTKSFETSVETTMKQQYEELGSIKFNEVGVLTLFCIMVFLWVFKDPQFIPGWDSLPIFGRSPTGKSLIKECTPTLMICFLMFAIPGKYEYYRNFFQGGMY